MSGISNATLFKSMFPLKHVDCDHFVTWQKGSYKKPGHYWCGGCKAIVQKTHILDSATGELLQKPKKCDCGIPKYKCLFPNCPVGGTGILP